MIHDIVKFARRMIVVVVGFTVLLVGVAMIVLPGPAIIVIPAGLAILSAEFLWARSLLRQIRSAAEGVLKRNGATPSPADPSQEESSGRAFPP